MSYTRFSSFVTVLLILSMLCIAQSEAKLGKVVITDGEIKMGSVTGMTDIQIQFVHEHETLTYTFDKSKISKIEFGSSGRIEVYNQVQAKSTADPN